MKKGLIFLLGIISFFGINKVSASTETITILNYYDHFEEYINTYNTYKENIDYMINYWEENYSVEYPYYYIQLSLSKNTPSLYLFASKTNIIASNPVNSYFQFRNSKNIIVYSIATNTYQTDSYVISEAFVRNTDDNDGLYNNYKTTLIHNGLVYGGLYDSDTKSYFEQNFLINSYSSESLDISIPDIELTTNSPWPSIMSLYDGSYFSSNNFIEINLNDYPYVALSLKDYSVTEQFYTNMYVQGQLCLTPVYNYGMTEKTEYYSSYQVQRCSSYYETSTLTRVYILADDLKNNAIYYLKAYNTSKENIVKIDTSIFDITYITEENKDNPYVLIDGKNYPTIAYDKLSSTATKSEDEDYISGVTCQVGDFNCYNEYNPSNVFNDLFDKPLEMLKSVWGAIVSIFTLISEFIALLPPTMQGFLYLAFGVGIALGIIKILL